jgi:hypothetical protein
MNRIDARCISPGVSRANSQAAWARRGFYQQGLVALDGLERVAGQLVGAVGGLDALALEVVVAAGEAANRALVEQWRLHRGRADGQHPDTVCGGLRAQRQ